MTVLVLASKSPARLATLRSAGIEPFVLVSDVDEDAAVVAARAQHDGPDELAAEDVALLLANAKCEAVASVLAQDEVPAETPDAFIEDGGIILGCDSVLEFDGAILGKPADAADARAAEKERPKKEEGQAERRREAKASPRRGRRRATRRSS